MSGGGGSRVTTVSSLFVDESVVIKWHVEEVQDDGLAGPNQR